MPGKDINSKSHRLGYIRINKEEPNVTSEKYRQFIKKHKGFDFTNEEDLKNYQDFYKVNLNIYSFNEETEEFNLEGEYLENEEYKLMSVVVHYSHAILMNPNKIQEITKFLICPKCGEIIGRFEN